MSKDEKEPLLTSNSIMTNKTSHAPTVESTSLLGKSSEPVRYPQLGASVLDDHYGTVDLGPKQWSDLRFVEQETAQLNHAVSQLNDKSVESGCCSGFKTKRKRRKLEKFYQKQLKLLDAFSEDSRLIQHGDVGEEAQAELSAAEARRRRLDEILAQITFGLNVCLLIAKVVAAVLSHSLSVFATVIDSLVDITSGLVIWLTLRAIKSHNPYEYPRGRNKLEPLAVVIVAIIMGAANLVMIIQSIQSIVSNTVKPEVDAISLGILLAGTGIKLVLWIICMRQKTPGAMVLAMDQRNDIITNLAALGMGLIGTHYWIYADPIGAILVCTYIAGSWFYTCAEQIPILTGKVAEAEMFSRIINIVINHDHRIRKLDALWVYHYGTKFLVELHIVLKPEMSLEEAHNLAEPLTMKLEKMPYVERAFIHCDYKVDSADHGVF